MVEVADRAAALALLPAYVAQRMIVEEVWEVPIPVTTATVEQFVGVAKVGTLARFAAAQSSRFVLAARRFEPVADGILSLRARRGLCGGQRSL